MKKWPGKKIVRMETTATSFVVVAFAATTHKFKTGITSYWLHHFPFDWIEEH